MIMFGLSMLSCGIGLGIGIFGLVHTIREDRAMNEYEN